MASQSFLEFTEAVSPPAFTEGFSGAYYGVCLALTANLIAEGMRLALVMPWVLEEDSPDDVLPYLGNEVRLPRYPGETSAAYRARIAAANEIYDLAGTPACINQQIAAAGLDGTVFFQPGHPGPNFEPFHWSQFWILTTVTNAEAHATIRAIARKWKPVTWIFRGFVFDFPDTGGDSTFAEPTFAQNSWAT